MNSSGTCVQVHDRSVITYVTNWNRVTDDVIEKEKDLLSNNLDFFIVNSSSFTKNDWINIGNAWCYSQIYEILLHSSKLNYDYTSMLFGDVSASEGNSISNHVEQTIKNINRLPNCYVYSPSFTHDGWSGKSTILRKYDSEISYVCGVDTLYLTIHREISEIMLNLMKYFDDMNGLDNFSSGWGFDVVCCAISIYLGKNVFRDTSSVLFHENNSGYEVDGAHKEFLTFLAQAINFWNDSGNDGRRLFEIIRMIFAKRDLSLYTYDDFYGV